MGQVNHEVDVSGIATKVSVFGASVSAFGGVSYSEFIALIGLCITLLGFTVNFVFQWRRDRREVALHKAQKRALRPSGQYPTYRSH